MYRKGVFKMIYAAFLRNFKIYDGIKFIPITTGDYFSSYFGLNGVGKSSILEALDSFFNSTPLIINNNKSSGYMNDSYVVPVFLEKKSEWFDKKKESLDILEQISSFFWNTQDFASSSSELSEFKQLRNFLLNKYSPDDYYFFAIGVRNFDFKIPYFGPFQREPELLKIFNILKSDVKNQTDKAKEEDEAVKKFFEKKKFLDFIRNQFYYIYIPADINIKDYTKLETENMQKLMHKNVTEEIAKSIGQKKLDEINNSLDNLIKNISEKLKNYTYQKKAERQNKITMPDLTSKIIQSYFATKVLTKKNPTVTIDDMSSGEKHKALIDVCFAFLDEENVHDHKVILAIDEPEISLHVSACYEQFEKLKLISNKKHQVLITTHWYGFLPVVGQGLAHNITLSEEKLGKREIHSYNIGKFQEEIRLGVKHDKKLPDDVFLKSRYDLAQSIISSIRFDNPYNYLLVEGSSDKIYLESYLTDFINKCNLRIVPLGGCGEVKNLMALINASVDDRNMDVKGKVVAIIDTDNKRLSIDWKNTNNFIFKRIIYDEAKEDITLIDVNSDLVAPQTSIEDVLEPELFIETLKTFVNTDEDFKFLSDFSSNAKCSYNAVDYKQSQRKNVIGFFSEGNNKVEFAKKYTKNELHPERLQIITDICNCFGWNRDFLSVRKTQLLFSENITPEIKNKKKIRVYVKKKNEE